VHFGTSNRDFQFHDLHDMCSLGYLVVSSIAAMLPNLRELSWAVKEMIEHKEQNNNASQNNQNHFPY
jgi:hypothetical protein